MKRLELTIDQIITLKTIDDVQNVINLLGISLEEFLCESVELMMKKYDMDEETIKEY